MISVFGSLIGDEEVEGVVSCMRSQWVGFGKKVEEFEKKYMEKFRLKSFAMVDSGSNALFMAVRLLDLPAGSEVIVPTFTWVSCAHAVLMAGCKPVFCDVDLDAMNVRAIDIERRVTEKTRAVMVIHYAGLPADMMPIIKLGFPIIEDAAHAINSTYKGLPCGTIGDIGIYSYDAVKNMTTGEGGGITARNPDLITRAKHMRYCGIGKSGFDSIQDKECWWENDIYEPFIKMLPTDIAGSIGIAQLDRFDAMQEYRKSIWDRYQREFEGTRVITPIEAPVGSRHSYFTYCIRVRDRNQLARYLLDNEIYTTLRYKPLHLNPIFGQADVRLPNAEKLDKTALNIPLHPRLKEEDVTKVISKIKEFYANN